MTGPLVKGWCPGALKPMESGDGLIVRLKITGGIVPLDLAMKIAEWAARWGNGQIDLTARANLQIRGVAEAGIEPLQDAMAAAGLLDTSPEGEAVRNVIASPLAGIDPEAILDIRPIVAALEARLIWDERLHALPAKFGWRVDDGGAFALDDVRADVRFEAMMMPDGPAFALQLDGADGQAFGPCKADALADIAARIALAFLAYRSNARRMRDLVDEVGAEAVAGQAGLQTSSLYSQKTPPRGVLGLHSLADHQGNGLFALGVALPFGRIATGDLTSLAADATRSGATELRLTPWRAILVPVSTVTGARSLSTALEAGPLILDPADPLLRVAACVGAPACARATTDVRSDAARLAAFVPVGALLHASGCAKGCAHPRPATATLVGDGGTYALVQGGAPWDEPAVKGLDMMAAADAVRRIVAEGNTA